MESEMTQLSGNGRIVIPARFRKKLGLKPGEKLIVRMDDDGLRIETRLQSLKRAQRLMQTLYGPDRDPVQELIDERRLEAQRELDE